MPNFDGKGPLKRGRVIGRGLCACKRENPEDEETCSREKTTTDNSQKRSSRR